jgi:hypothetical protein
VPQASGVRIRWVRLAPILHQTLVGNYRGPWNAHTRDTLAGAYPAIGGTIPAHGARGLVFDLDVPHLFGRMGPVQVTYTDAHGTAHRWTGGTTQVYRPSC